MVNKSEKYIRMRYNGFKKAFIQQVCLYSCNSFPSILPITGYSIHNGMQDLFLPFKINGSLKNVMNNIDLMKKMNEDKKMIIAYGVAKAMEYLHENKVVHRNLNLDSIMIDSELQPYVYDFYCAVQTDSSLFYQVVETTPGFMAPEFDKYCEPSDNFEKIDVYSYGIILYILMTEKNPFDGKTETEISQNTKDGKRPEFTESISIEESWKKLIIQCWDHDPNKRPSFKDICISINGSFDSADFKSYKSNFIKFYRSLNDE